MLRSFLNKHWHTILVLCYFLLYLTIGLLVVGDYGIGVDETYQRTHTLVNYKFINEFIFHRTIPALKDYPELSHYDWYYGVALQIPMALYEDVYNFQLSTREIYLMRQTGCFLLCYIGYIFFFLSLKEIFKPSNTLPILGTFFVSLYPRFFSLQFADVKNMVFTSMCMITIFFMVMTVERRSSKWQVLFGIAAAFAVNTRMIGVILPVILIGFFVLDDVYGLKTKKKRFNGIMGKYFVIILSFGLCWYIITPRAWISPIAVFKASFVQSSNFDRWNNTMVFMGRLITCEEMPWYYLFIWFGICFPVYLLVLFFVAHFALIKGIIKNGVMFATNNISHDASNDHTCSYYIDLWEKIRGNKWLFFALVFFWGSVWGVIILRSRIYLGWHHMYFVFIPFCLIACFGLKYFIDFGGMIRRIIVIIVVCLVSNQCGWMIYYHPFQSSCFNMIGKHVASYFDREEQRLCSLNIVEWILSNENGTISISFADNDAGLYLLPLPAEQRDRFVINRDNPDYIVNFYRNVIGNEISYDGYEEVYTAWVDKYKIGSVFRRVERYLDI